MSYSYTASRVQCACAAYFRNTLRMCIRGLLVYCAGAVSGTVVLAAELRIRKRKFSKMTHYASSPGGGESLAVSAQGSPPVPAPRLLEVFMTFPPQLQQEKRAWRSLHHPCLESAHEDDDE
ncbi:hypothetical protein NDU88_000002 [Pleurodeles waltl]|uniref:Uncharacterized protein n=1 Tax=Pleurodeles waltl TaxID=8319 RepID=A0AAV7SVW7_PLEWA|nr:hypothetical protein NDU88_000002 [Pleurodeles waltl]